MRAGDAALQAEAPGLVGELLDVAGFRVVGLVAMQVHRQVSGGGDLAELGHGSAALDHGALEMRDAADHVHAEIEGAQRVRPRRGVAIEAVLREGDELEVEIGPDLLAHLEKRPHPEQPVVAGVHVAADREQAHGDRPVAITERTLHHRVMGHPGLELAPERDAFEQGAGGVDARQAVAERGVHVEMWVHEGRRDEAAGEVDGATGLGLDARGDPGDAVASDGDVGAAAVGQRSAGQEQVEAHRSPLR